MPFINAGIDKQGLDEITRDIELCKMTYGTPADQKKIDEKLADFIAFSTGQKELSEVIGGPEDEMSPIAVSYMIKHIKTEDQVRSFFLGPTHEGWQILSGRDSPIYTL